MLARVDEQCSEFERSGLCAGDRLLTLLPNGIHSVVIFLAAAKYQLTVVPMPSSAKLAALEISAEISGASAIAIWQPLIEDVFASDDLPGDDLPSKGFADNAGVSKSTSIGLKFNDWDVFVATNESDVAVLSTEHTGQPAHHASQENHQEVQPQLGYTDDIPYILTMTSGSTGQPKPIALSQNTKLKRARSAIDLYRLDSTDITLIATPLYHSLAQRLLFVSLLAGSKLVILPNYSPQRWQRVVSEQKITFTIAVASQLQNISTELANCQEHLLSLRVLVSSSALLEESVKSRLLSGLNCEFHECYGASEVAIATNIQYQRGKSVGSVGRAIAGVDLKIVDESQQSVPCNVIGEICVKSDFVFSGYHGQPDTTRQAFIGNYFKTGDMGYLDSHGKLYFCGRKKEIIVTGGINVFPADVEAVVSDIDGIETAVAFPVADPALGEVVGVAVVQSAGKHYSDGQLTMACAQQLCDYQLPRRWFRVDAIPRNELGKIQRYKLGQYFSDNSSPPQACDKRQAS
jgi:long-chain acyl-CoA synthetase